METIVKIKKHPDPGQDGFEVLTSEQSILLGIDNVSDCCEQWGHFWCNDNPDDFLGAGVVGVSITDTALITEKDPNLYEGGVMFVNIETDRGVLQFVAYNSHNGYYGHMAKVECKQLNFSAHL